MKIKQVIDALPALQKLSAQELDIKSLYKISKLFGNLDNEIAFYNTKRNEMLAKYCDAKDGQYIPREAEREKLYKELNDLLEIEIEEEVKEVVIGIDNDIKLSYNDLVLLKGFVRIGEE